jgi:hypothetical protein
MPDNVPEESRAVAKKPRPESAGMNVAKTPSGPAGSQTANQQRWAQTVILAALFSAPALVCVHLATVADPDVWWHLRTGQWVMQHGSVPRTEPFSIFGAGKPWVAYSWLFEVLIFRLFQWLGMTGLVAYTVGMLVAITVALHRMNRRLQADFTVAVLLTFACSFCLISLWTPRPWMFTILFFVVELDILMQARKSGRTDELFWLPLLFALWANLHIQFVVGLLVMAISLGESLLAYLLSGMEKRINPIRLGAISLACILATLINPYGWRIYAVARDLASQHGVMDKVSELKAIPFRGLQDYGVLFLALAAAGVVARARRLQFFEIALLGFAVLVSFRSLRDIWVVVVVASAIIASGVQGDARNQFQVKAWAAPIIAAATVLVTVLGFRLLGVNNQFLAGELAKSLPVHAVEFVKKSGLSGPIYDDYSWGGYFIWDPGWPVIIDSRQNVYGDARIARSVATWGGVPDWDSDPELLKSALVIGPVNAPLTQLLRLSPHFKLVYEDKVAVVFAATHSFNSAPGGDSTSGTGATAGTVAK